jgi:GDP-L-fucose synthase
MERDDKILVTGGNGLVGTALTCLLRSEGFVNVTSLTRNDCDLLNYHETLRFFEQERPDFVFHAAARVYGIMGNMKNKAQSFYDNVMINTNVVDSAFRVGVKKITAMGTGAVYPYPSPTLPLTEDTIFMGTPHPAEDSYAQAKRAMLSMLKAYEESYGMEWAYVVSCNLFGPHDKFDTEFGHVVPSLIKKFYDAKLKKENVVIWGDGSARRDFMYVKDAARVNLSIMEGVNGPANIGSGHIYSILDIVQMLTDISDLHGRVTWDSTKPNGQDYRAYDLSKINSIGFECEYSIREGLTETWEWYNHFSKNS